MNWLKHIDANTVTAIATSIGALGTIAMIATTLILARRALYPAPSLTLDQIAGPSDSGIFEFLLKIENRGRGPIYIFRLSTRAQPYARIWWANSKDKYIPNNLGIDWAIRPGETREAHVRVMGMEWQVSNFVGDLYWSPYGSAGREQKITFKFKARAAAA